MLAGNGVYGLSWIQLNSRSKEALVPSRFLMTAALATGVCAAACSKPAADAGRATDARSDREIQLVRDPDSGAPVVSDLEARRAPKSVHNHVPEKVTAAAAMDGSPDAKATPDYAAMALVELAPVMDRTASSVLDAPRALEAAPYTLFPINESDRAASRGDDSGPEIQARPPAILIRGGAGGVDDKCDLHNRGGRPGIAINTIAPRPGGYGRTGMSGSFPRRGIR